MALPQAMARKIGHDRSPALAGGHDHNVATRPTPPEPNIKITASRRDAKNRDTLSLASLRDAVFICDYIRWCRSPSLAQLPSDIWQTSGLLQRHRSKVAQAAKPADEAKPRPVQKNKHPVTCGKQSRLGRLRYERPDTRSGPASFTIFLPEAGLAACATVRYVTHQHH
jgi:hypothetical protein